MISAGGVQRDEIFVATKGGFLSFDADEPSDSGAYFEENFIQTGIVRPDDVAAGCHVMSPAFLENQIETSRGNLGLETIDLYYLHNPETQFSQVSRPDFYRRLKAAFAHELALRLAPGGYLHVATDWEEYALEILTTLDQETLLANVAPDFATELHSAIRL